MRIEKEIWKPVVGLELFYEVSSYGNLKRLSRFKDNNGGKVFVKEKIVNLHRSSKGYVITGASIESKKHHFILHRLVAMAFIDNPLNLPQVNHIDEVKDNNFYKNLEWCNNRQNKTHSLNNVKRTSKYIGVHWSKSLKKWCCQINIQKTTYTIGHYKDELEAKKAYEDSLLLWETKKQKPKITKNRAFFKKRLNGEIIKEYSSLNHACDDGYNLTSVSMALNGNYPHKNGFYKGLIWEHDS